MQAKIDTLRLKNSSDEEIIIYPRTLIKCITDEEGNSLDTTLKEYIAENVNDVIDEVVDDTYANKTYVDTGDTNTLSEAKEYNDAAYANANAYTDQKIADLINGAPTTLDTLGEIATAMSENKDVVTALNQAIGEKANQAELDTHTGNDVIHTTNTEKNAWNKNTTDIAAILNGTVAAGNALKLNGLTAEHYAKTGASFPMTIYGFTNDFGIDQSKVYNGTIDDLVNALPVHSILHTIIYKPFFPNIGIPGGASEYLELYIIKIEDLQVDIRLTDNLYKHEYHNVRSNSATCLGWHEKYLPLDGSVPMSTDLFVANGYARVSGHGDHAQLEARNVVGNTANRRTLVVRNSLHGNAPTVKTALVLQEIIGGVVTTYDVLHTGNMKSHVLPIDGSVPMSGVLTVPEWIDVNSVNDSNKKARVGHNKANNCTYLINYDSANNVWRGLNINPSLPKGEGLEYLDASNGVETYYTLLHTGNMNLINGGNADTVDGCHASDFLIKCPLNSINIDTHGGNWSTDVSEATACGTNPFGWSTVIQFTGNHFLFQIAHDCGGTGGKRMATRSRYASDESWGEWVHIANLEELANYLPLTGGTLTGPELGIRNGIGKVYVDGNATQLSSYGNIPSAGNSRSLLLWSVDGQDRDDRAITLRTYRNGSATSEYTVLHSGNISSYVSSLGGLSSEEGTFDFTLSDGTAFVRGINYIKMGKVVFIYGSGTALSAVAKEGTIYGLPFTVNPINTAVMYLGNDSAPSVQMNQLDHVMVYMGTNNIYMYEQGYVVNQPFRITGFYFTDD